MHFRIELSDFLDDALRLAGRAGGEQHQSPRLHIQRLQWLQHVVRRLRHIGAHRIRQQTSRCTDRRQQLIQGGGLQITQQHWRLAGMPGTPERGRKFQRVFKVEAHLLTAHPLKGAAPRLHPAHPFGALHGTAVHGRHALGWHTGCWQCHFGQGHTLLHRFDSLFSLHRSRPMTHCAAEPRRTRWRTHHSTAIRQPIST